MSMASPQSGIPIDDKVLAPFKAEAAEMLRRATGRIPAAPFQGSSQKAGYILDKPMSSEPITASLVKIGQKVSGDPELLAEGVAQVFGELRRSIQIGLYLSGQYSRMSGLDQLIDRNKTSTLGGPERDEMAQKNATASAIALFSASYYLAW